MLTALLGKHVGRPVLHNLEALLVELAAEHERRELRSVGAVERRTYLVEIEVHGGRVDGDKRKCVQESDNRLSTVVCAGRLN